MKRFLKHLFWDLLFWFGIFHMVTDSIFQWYAYNAISFVIACKFVLSVFVFLAIKHVKVEKRENDRMKRFHWAYSETTQIIECIVLATFGFGWLAAAHGFGFVVHSMLKQRYKEMYEPDQENV